MPKAILRPPDFEKLRAAGTAGKKPGEVKMIRRGETVEAHQVISARSVIVFPALEVSMLGDLVGQRDGKLAEDRRCR